MTEKGKKAAKEKKSEPTKKGEKAKTPKKTEVKEKTKETEVLRTYVIPLRQVFRGFRTRRAKHASKVVKDFIQKHLKTDEINIDPSVGEFLHSKGKCSIPRRVKVVVSKGEDKTIVRLAE